MHIQNDTSKILSGHNLILSITSKGDHDVERTPNMSIGEVAKIYRFVVEVVRKTDMPDKHTNLIISCKKLWEDMSSIEVRHYSHEENKGADAMAKACRSSMIKCNVTGIFPSPIVII